MKILNKIASIVSFGKKRNFEELPNWLLALFGAPAFLVASYYALMFADVIPDLVKTVNKNGMTWGYFVLFLWLGFYAAVTWAAGCVAARCHKLLFERWFK